MSRISQFRLQNNKFIVTAGTDQAFTTLTSTLPPAPIDVIVYSIPGEITGATGVEFNSVPEAAVYNFYVDSVGNESQTFLGQAVVKNIPMNKLFPGTAFYPKN